MEAFATTEDLEKRWRPLTGDEKPRSETLLEEATAIIRFDLAKSGVAVDAEDELQSVNLRIVCCSMVQRVLAQDNDAGYAQATVTAGPYTQSWSPANPDGNMYISAKEAKRLGIGCGRIGTIRPLMGVSDDTW